MLSVYSLYRQGTHFSSLLAAIKLVLHPEKGFQIRGLGKGVVPCRMLCLWEKGAILD